jgi:hypothetical protein
VCTEATALSTATGKARTRGILRETTRQYYERACGEEPVYGLVVGRYEMGATTGRAEKEVVVGWFCMSGLLLLSDVLRTELVVVSMAEFLNWRLSLKKNVLFRAL